MSLFNRRSNNKTPIIFNGAGKHPGNMCRTTFSTGRNRNTQPIFLLLNYEYIG